MDVCVWSVVVSAVRISFVRFDWRRSLQLLSMAASSKVSRTRKAASVCDRNSAASVLMLTSPVDRLRATVPSLRNHSAFGAD